MLSCICLPTEFAENVLEPLHRLFTTKGVYFKVSLKRILGTLLIVFDELQCLNGSCVRIARPQKRPCLHNCNTWEIMVRHPTDCLYYFANALFAVIKCLQCFDAVAVVGLQEGHPVCKKTEWWGAGVVMCLGQGADLHMAQLMPLPLTVSCSSKSRLVLPSWFYLSGAGSPG